MKHVILRLTLAWLLALGVSTAFSASPSNGPFTVNIYSHPWYTLNPQAATRPFVAICTKLVDRLFRRPEDTLSIWVKPPWPLACGQPWVNTFLAAGDKDALDAMEANAAARGFELPKAQRVFCSSTISAYPTASYVKISTADGVVQAEGPLMDDDDLGQLLSQLEAKFGPLP